MHIQYTHIALYPKSYCYYCGYCCYCYCYYYVQYMILSQLIADVFMALQGLWQQRQGFLTAAAKREQRHLSEAEAEVLRHVAKLVPEAEVPHGSPVDPQWIRRKHGSYWILARRKCCRYLLGQRHRSP